MAVEQEINTEKERMVIINSGRRFVYPQTRSIEEIQKTPEGLAEIIQTKTERFTIFRKLNLIRCEKGEFIPTEPIYTGLHELPKEPEPGSKNYAVLLSAWRRERENVEEMNAILQMQQQKEFKKRIASIRKQYQAQERQAHRLLRAQRPSLWEKIRRSIHHER